MNKQKRNTTVANYDSLRCCQCDNGRQQNENKQTNRTIHLMQAADAAWQTEEGKFQRLLGRAAGRVRVN